MKAKTKSYVAILMGVIIAIADIWWTVTSSYYTLWLTLGIVILIADLIWLYIDYSFMKN